MELTERNRQYIAAVEACIPDGFTMVPGWPDEEHRITWEYYCDWAHSQIDNLEEGDDIGTFMSFDEWKQMKRDEDEERDNLGFSRTECELCGALPGERYAASAIKPGTGKYLTYEICGDCLQYIANGELPHD